MIKISVCYSSKHGSEFASCSVSDVEFTAAILDDPHGFTNEILKVYHRCQTAVEAQLFADPEDPEPQGAPRPASPRQAPAPAQQQQYQQPPPQAQSAPQGNPGNKQYGPPKSARTFAGWINGDNGRQYRDRAQQICKAQGYTTKFVDLADDQAMWVYHQLTAVPAVQPAWGGPPLAENGTQAY